MILQWTTRAFAERRDIRAYIALDNPLAALKLDMRFDGKAAQLLDHPLIGRAGRLPGTRELVVHPYLLIYDIQGDCVRILRVIHGARHIP